MSTLVTGGTGFVGSNVVKTLARRGHRVICLDVMGADAMVRKYLEPWRDAVTFVQGSILDRDDLSKLSKKYDITNIVHAAVFTALSSGIETEQSRSIVDVNVVGTANLLDLAATLPLERFVYVSSQGVYGDARVPDEVVSEDACCYPRNLYGTTKYFSELLTRRYGELHGFSTASVRLGGPYGPMERHTGYRVDMSGLYQWTRNLVRGEPVRVGDRTLVRDYTYVADIAGGICDVLDASALSYQEYNLSTGIAVTLEDVIGVLKRVRPSMEVIDDPAAQFGGWRPSLTRGLMDVSRIREDVGFTPTYDLEEGLKEYLEWREEFGFV